VEREVSLRTHLGPLEEARSAVSRLYALRSNASRVRAVDPESMCRVLLGIFEVVCSRVASDSWSGFGDRLPVLDMQGATCHLLGSITCLYYMAERHDTDVLFKAPGRSHPAKLSGPLLRTNCSPLNELCEHLV